MAGLDDIVIAGASSLSSPKRGSVRKCGTSGYSYYLTVPQEADEILAEQSSADEGGRGSDYGTDREEIDPLTSTSTSRNKVRSKSASSPALITPPKGQFGPKKRSFPKLFPSEEFQKIFDGISIKKSPNRRKSM